MTAAGELLRVRFGDWEPEDSVRIAPGVRAVLLGEFEDGVTLTEALAAYPAIGEKCFSKLRGRFALLVWDRRRDCIWALRDPMGTHPLFHAREGDAYVFAASASELIREAGVRAPLNKLAIADSFRNSWPLLEETWYSGIERVPPGHALRIDRGGARASRYWLPRGESVRWLKGDEMDQFGPLFEQAVERTLCHGRNAIFLSGGLDSVSIAAVASDIAKRERQPRLQALSLEFPHPDSNERDVQVPVAVRLGIPHLLMPLESAVDSPRGVLGATLAVSARLDSPAINLWLSGYLELAARARDRGCSTILTGTGGDEWLGITPVLAADLLSKGRLRDWARLMALGWRSSRHAATPRAIRNYLWDYSVRPLIRERAVRFGARAFPGWLARRRRKRALANLPAWLLPDPSLRRQIAERGEEFDRVQDDVRDPSYYVEELRQTLDHPISSLEHEEWFQAYGPAGIEVRHPFYDADLVEFLFRVPPENLISAGRSKGLVRDTLARRFPRLGFEAQKKVEASAYFRDALQAQAPRLWREFGDLWALRELGIVDPAKVPDPASFGAGAYRDQFNLWLLLNTEAWLRPRM